MKEAMKHSYNMKFRMERIVKTVGDEESDN